VEIRRKRGLGGVREVEGLQLERALLDGGNEVYGGWEYDLHAQKNDPGTYAAAVAGSNGYYQLMKNADSTAQVGVVVEGMPGSWTTRC